MANQLKQLWLLRHGAPKFFSSDVESEKRAMRTFLAAHEIERRPRPVRRYNETGIVERKIRTLKSIFERIQLEKTDASDATVLYRETFFSNVFAGSSTLSSFELSR